MWHGKLSIIQAHLHYTSMQISVSKSRLHSEAMSLLKNLEQFKQKPCLVTPFLNSKPHTVYYLISASVFVCVVRSGEWISHEPPIN